MDNIRIDSDRFIVRTLRLNDNFDAYLSWMKDVENNKYILTVRSDYSLEELTSFVDRNNRSPSEILLGIFTKNLKHIGNIRYSNINRSEKTAEVGFLIGDLDFRGLGIAKEVFLCTMNWMSSKLQIKTVYLGVHPQNIPATKLYKKLGFLQIESSGPEMNSMWMKLDFSL